MHDTVPLGSPKPIVVKFADERKPDRLDFRYGDESKFGMMHSPGKPVLSPLDFRPSSFLSGIASTESSDKHLADYFSEFPDQRSAKSTEGPSGANLFVYHLPRDVDGSFPLCFTSALALTGYR